MRVERRSATTLVVTAQAYEVAALLAAARWLVDRRPDDVPAEAVAHLEAVVGSFDDALDRLAAGAAS